MAEIAVRRATEADVDGIVALGAAVAPVTYGPISPGYAEWCLDRWWSRPVVEEQTRRLPHWVGTAGETVVGVTNLGANEDGPTMWKLYVHPDHQHRGIGTALLREVETAAEGPDLRLEYLDGNTRAAAFYRAHGFVESHRTVLDSFPDLTWVWMRKELG